MARGVYLIGSKLAQRVRAVQIVDCAGNSTTLRLKDYLSRNIQPAYKVLPWQDDVALAPVNEKVKIKVRWLPERGAADRGASRHAMIRACAELRR